MWTQIGQSPEGITFIMSDMELGEFRKLLNSVRKREMEMRQQGGGISSEGNGVDF